MFSGAFAASVNYFPNRMYTASPFTFEPFPSQVAGSYFLVQSSAVFRRQVERATFKSLPLRPAKWNLYSHQLHPPRFQVRRLPVSYSKVSVVSP